MEIETGGPAFPFEEMHTDGTHYHSHPGLSLRDYFAAKAMASWNANPLPDDRDIHSIAAWAYRQADAMLKERNK